MKIFLLIALFALGGCAEFQALKSSVGSYSKEAADQALDVKGWAVCNAMSRGAMMRKFDTPEKLDTLNEFCEVFREVTP